MDGSIMDQTQPSQMQCREDGKMNEEILVGEMDKQTGRSWNGNCGERDGRVTRRDRLMQLHGLINYYIYLVASDTAISPSMTASFLAEERHDAALTRFSSCLASGRTHGRFLLGRFGLVLAERLP